MDGGHSAPTTNLYVALPNEGLLQMCIMRPTPEDICPPLPFLVPPPAAPSLGAAGLASSVMAAADVIGWSDAPSSLPSSRMPRRADSASSRLSSSERLELLRTAEQMALNESWPLAVDFVRLTSEDWSAAFAARRPAEGSGAEPFQQLGAPALRRVALAAGSEALCDLLLQHALPRLLHPQEATGSQRLRPSEGAGAIDEDVPLPAPLSALLLVLLHGGSHLRQSATDFDARVVHPLRCLSAPLGARAAAQAALTFAATRSQSSQN